MVDVFSIYVKVTTDSTRVNAHEAPLRTKEYGASVKVGVDNLGLTAKGNITLPKHISDKANDLFAEIKAYIESEAE